MKDGRILITGGCGFVGTNLVALLIEKGLSHLTIVVDRVLRWRLSGHLTTPKGIEFLELDIRSSGFAKALANPSHPQPRVINTDKAKCYPSAIDESKGEGVLRKRCRHRPVQYLNNILEQDHRAIKKRIRAKQHFRQFGCARRTIQGYEVIHKIRKGQVRWVKKGDVLAQNQFIDRVFGLTL